MANPILGLNQRELGIVAFLGRYHSSYVSSEILQSSNELGPEDHLKAVKLLSILRLADAMDKGHRQKLSLEEIKLDGEKLTLFASANQEPRWKSGFLNIRPNCFSRYLASKHV